VIQAYGLLYTKRNISKIVPSLKPIILSLSIALVPGLVFLMGQAYFEKALGGELEMAVLQNSGLMIGLEMELLIKRLQIPGLLIILLLSKISGSLLGGTPISFFLVSLRMWLMISL
jgi:hypothetical protein